MLQFSFKLSGRFANSKIAGPSTATAPNHRLNMICGTKIEAHANNTQPPPPHIADWSIHIYLCTRYH